MILFESWYELLRVAVSAIMVYPFVILAVRIYGKRSTSRMNNFDWIVTVAMGSIVGSAILLKDVVILEFILAISMLLALQYIVTKASIHSDIIARVVRAKPTLLYYDGSFLQHAMHKERVTREEIESSVRTQGYSNMSEVSAVIIEADANLSVLRKLDGASALIDKVHRPNPDSDS